jgi:adenosylhomocysteine nucleosidase
MKNKILILTALSLEFDEIRSLLSNRKIESHPSASSIYTRGVYKSGDQVYDILLVETGPGNTKAADETSRAMDYFKPDFVFFIGVAGGVKDVKLGDVVASTKIIGYETGKDDITFKPRFDTMPASYLLEQLAKLVKRENVWRQKISDLPDRIPEAFVQPIAAGDKVVSSNKSVVFSYLKQHASDAVAVDMEGVGFLASVRPYHAHAIEIRGISDLIENKEDADASGSQPMAVKSAAAFAFSIIDQLSIQHPVKENIHTLEFQKKLVDELSKLYSQGPDQDDIWKRAGGDVSILINSASRKSQWFGAIEKLSLGGGGKGITLESLINEVKTDFPNIVTDLFKL